MRSLAKIFKATLLLLLLSLASLFVGLIIALCPGKGRRLRAGVACMRIWAWHGAMTLLPHLWNILGMKKLEVRVHFNPVIKNVMALDAAKKRKLVSSMAHESVLAGYRALMTEVSTTPKHFRDKGLTLRP